MTTSYNYDKLTADFRNLFGSKQVLDVAWLKKLQNNCWVGQTRMPMRGVSWRVLLGILPVDTSCWPEKMEKYYMEYEELKDKHLPDINSVKVDPLSGMSAAEEDTGDWAAYYKKVEMVKFIQGDLERLYMNGIEGEFFQEPHRARALLNVLFVWAEQNPSTSGYRQGMHEIAAPVLLVLEAEVALWSAALLSQPACTTTNDLDSALTPYFSDEKYIESSMYWLFDRIMQELEYLYKPPAQAGDQPGVVKFCTQVQEEMLRALDPDLCTHLEENYVQAQLYGMRWSRLLLGREFQVIEESLFRIWDYIFASSLSINSSISIASQNTEIVVQQSGDVESSKLSHPLFDSPSPARDSAAFNLEEEYVTSSAEMKALRKSRLEKPSPILESLADFMLAMLLHIREDLLHGDNSTTLQLLMRYPPVDDITPIMDLADMIRRGVLDSNSHVGALRNVCVNHYDEEATAEQRHESITTSTTPTWLWREGFSNVNKKHDNDSSFSIKNNLRGVSRRVSEKLHAVSATVTSFSHDDFHKKSAQGDDSGSSPTRKASIGTKNSLFGTSTRGRSNSKMRTLFGDPLSNDIDTIGKEDEGESLVPIDKRSIKDDKCSVLVHNDINRIATFLECWATDKSREDPSNFMPNIVNRLRQLGGLLDESVTLSEYTNAHEEGSLEYRGRLRSVDSTCSNDKSDDEIPATSSSPLQKTTTKSSSSLLQETTKSRNEPLESDLFVINKNVRNDFSFKETQRKHSSLDDEDDLFLPSSMKGRDKSSDEAKIDAIFSDLTGATKKKFPEKSPFDF